LPPAPAPAFAELSRPLTSREQEIANLLGRGLTNRQVAMRLGMSVRTADTHVCRILRKLGVRCRGEIAAWVQAAPMHTYTTTSRELSGG
jgi:non-specific serine/threonine protein kinase